MRFSASLLVAAMLAGLIVSLTTPQHASAAVTDYQPATYNMQGGAAGTGTKWTTDIPRLTAQYNVIALQEAGSPPGSAQYRRTYSNMGRRGPWAGWDVVHYWWRPAGSSATALPWNLYWMQTDFNGNRVNLAMLTRTPAQLLLVAAPAFWNQAGRPTSRPALGVRMPASQYQSGAAFYTVHAVSGNGAGNDGPGLLRNIQDQVNRLPAGGLTWAAMGDWNREPANLTVGRGLHKYRSNRATHIGGNGTNRELDYMVSNQRIAGYGGVGIGMSSDHFAVGFRRLAANASVQLLNAHDGNRALDVRSQNSSSTGSDIVSVNSTPGQYGHFKFVPAANNHYTIRIVRKDGNPEQCLDAIGTFLQRYSCDGTASQRFDMQYWSDTGQIRLKPENRTTCIGDDTDFGWGTELVTTMSCSKGEARFNFRFDNDPGPNAPLVVF